MIGSPEILTGASALLAVADEHVFNEAAVALSPTIGWWMLTAAVLLGLVFTLHRETWRRLWLRAEDPRSMGLFRIVFGLMTVANINGLWEIFTYLFTDEGLFLTDVSRRVFANSQFEGFLDGFGDDVPYGFMDWAAVVEFLKGPKYSLLFFWDSPTAFWIHLVAFELACLALVVGFQTRYSKWIALVLFHSISLRNAVYWEGTENVYRCFLFYLCLSRCGEAYSVDNWLRCRRLRKAGLLSEPGLPGDGAGAPPSAAHPKGLEPIYRLIPGWPRVLMMLQLAALYCTTGVVKNGAVWAKGDAFYYALNLDHFYRFEPQALSAIFGTNLFRVNTIVVHWWESCFPLVVVGLLIRFHLRERIPRLEGWQLWASRLLWALFGVACLMVVDTALPVHPVRGYSTERLQLVVRSLWIGGMVLIAVMWVLLRYRPPRVTLRGKERVLDLDWFCSWFLGRRVWLTLGFIFHVHLMLLMNIGWFTPGTLAAYLPMLHGREVAGILSRIGHRLAKLGPLARLLPARVRRGEPPLPAAAFTLPQHIRDAAAVPAWAIVAAIGGAAFGVYLTVEHGVVYRRVGFALLLFLAVVAALRARQNGRRRPPLSKIDPYTGAPRQPWAYGPLGRFVVAALTIYHVVGVALWLLPDKDCLSTWREEALNPVKWWLRTTQTTQGWRMFAPNPPRSNLFMRVLVTTQDGKVLDMNTDVYHPANRPLPWIWYTRQRKI
ncbi:MAG: HTTM domain-containing protein, partial [Myxococcales bacterium]|nr:HTTM domain-containing protein [Myxococcales bacterium]